MAMPIQGDPTSMVAMILLVKIVMALVVIFAAYGVAIIVKYVLIWRQARAAEAPIGFGDVVKMRWRNIDPRVIITAFRTARMAQLDLTVGKLEQHLRHGGRVSDVVEAMGLAKAHNIRASWPDLCRTDLEGHNPLQQIRLRVQEKERRRAP